MDTGDTPPPHFTTSINELRRFSTALSAFISSYDEFHSHLSFINSSIDSKLPNHLVQTTNPNLSSPRKVRLLETSCDQKIIALPEVIVLEQNPKESVSDCERSHESARPPDSTGFSHNSEEVDTSEKLEVVDVSKNSGEIDVSENPVAVDASNKPEIVDVPKKLEEIEESKDRVVTDTLKKHEETVSETLCDDQTITAVAEAIVSEQNPYGTDNCEQSHENVRTPESLEEIDVSKKPELTDILNTSEQTAILNKPEEIDTSKKKQKGTGTCKTVKENGTLKKFTRKLQFLCKHMSSKALRLHVEKHISETINLREEIVKALKLAKDPAKLILQSTARFFEQDSGLLCKYSGSHQDEQNARLASVLILECFVMISSDDGVEIAKENCERAAKDAVIWKNRMIREGGFGHTDEVAARGLLLLISGFGIQDDVFTIQDILDLIRVSNVKGISAALRRSVFLLPKIPEVISLMVKNNLETEAVDMAYTFGLEDLCNPRNILMTSLHNKVEDVQNGSPFQMRHENVRTSESLEEIDVSKKPELTDILNTSEQTDILNKPENIDTCNEVKETGTLKGYVKKLQSSCKYMDYKGMRWQVVKHFSETNLREEVAKALKLSKDPAKLVLISTGRFFEKDSRSFCKDYGSHQNRDSEKRLASVLILECFVMISGDDGIEIADEFRELAAKDAVIWKNRMIRKGGFGHTDEVDARGLLLLISGFGIQDDVFTIQDILDLIRASNVKGISAALRRSVFLIPKIPEVISLMVKNNLEIEAVDMANTFGLEDLCNPGNILTTYLQHNKVEDVQNGSPFQMSHEKVRTPESLEEINVSKKPELTDILNTSEQTDVLNKPENIDTCNEVKETGTLKRFVKKLQSCCKYMDYKGMRWQVVKHFSKTNLREEVAKALKRSKDPAKLVLISTDKFFEKDSRSFCKDYGSYQNGDNERRLASVLLLECFVMISGDDGIEIANEFRERAAKDAVVWKNRMIREGGFGHTDEVDARGLLLLISGFGIQDDDFTIQDISDLIRASNVKGISAALRRSVFLIPKIPEVIDLMVKNNLEIEAVDIAYTFGLEDLCNPRNILTTYLQHNKVVDVQNSSPIQTLDAVKQQLFDLKSTKQCLESHNVDPSILLPDIKINENIQNLEKKVNEWKVIQKRKYLETLIHQEAKRACYGHENRAIVSEQNPNGMATNREQSHEQIDISNKPEQSDICKNPTEETVVLKKGRRSKKNKETGILKKAEADETSTKPVVSVLQSVCQNMNPKKLRRHVATNFSEMVNLREEIANALKLAKDPAKLVLSSIGRFFVSSSRSFCQNKQNQGRMAAVLVLECFVMISSDGIEVEKGDRECAAEAAVDWRNRMMKEGGFGHTDEVDARGLLLLISGFGIQDDVFKIQDIIDLIRASNVKGIATALCRSVFLFPKIPKVINWMVQSNLDIEAVDVAYTFRLEDMCRNILTTYLHTKIKDFKTVRLQKRFQLEAMKQHLFELKSVKQCLESHNVDPSTLLPKFKIIEEIQNLEKEINEWKLTKKRKSLETPIHNEAKRACFENVTPPESLEESNVSNNPEEVDTLNVLEEIDTSKKPEETVLETFCVQTTTTVPEAVVSEQNPNGIHEHMRTPENNEAIDALKNPEIIDVSKKLEQTDILNKPEEIDTSKKHEETEPSKNFVVSMLQKFMISELQNLCQSMSYQELKWHVATHLSEMSNLREEIANALRLAEDPAKLVLDSIGRFFRQNRRTFRRGLYQRKQCQLRQAAVLILECFVMISSDGVMIAKTERELAAKIAVDWKKRMIREGGFGHAEEVDARGLLLLISGFGIQDDVFKIQDIMDLIRASNVKGISTALLRSASLIQKIPWVIYMMVKSNLEIEAVDLAYTFGLENVCYPQDILRTYLDNKVKDFQNASSSQMPEAVEQHLSDLKSVKQCLESHNIDPSTLLPNFKINEKIQNLQKEVDEWKFIQIRKSLENPIHPEATDKIVDISKNPEEIYTCEEVDSSKKHAKIGTSKKPEETVPETSCDEPITAVPEAIISEQNPNRMDTNREQIHENVRTPENHDEIDILNEHEQFEELDTSVIPEDTDTLKNPEETVPETSCDQTTPVVPAAVVRVQNRERTADNRKWRHENALRETTVINISDKPEQTDIISALETLCQSMSSKEMKWHVASHFSEMKNLREEIAKALKLAEDPAKLVINSIGAFFVQDRKTFCQNKQNQGRMAAVLILECFVMISSDGIEIAKGDLEYAAQAAVDWRKRMMREGGFGHADEVDARGLLFLISGFGIQDNVFKIQDVMDLVRASYVKGISNALRRSVFLVPKIPEVIDLMVKNNLEIEAADLAFTFGLEDKCRPLDILATFLRNHIRPIQNGPSYHMLEEMKQQLSDLKSVKQCLESHDIHDSTINEKIQNLEKELSEGNLIQKRESLENPIHHEAKRACFGHENMPHDQYPVDHYGLNRCYRSTHPSTGYFDSDRNLHNNYISKYSPSSVYTAPAMPENLTNPVPVDHMHRLANVQPYGWREPYVQPYLRHDQTYESQPYVRSRPLGWGPPEPFPPIHPSGGFPERRGPSSDLYGFADIVERETRR